MNSLKDKLSSFTDLEFAYFFQFRLKELLPASKEIAQVELKKRGLSLKSIADLTSKKIEKEKGNCPRCNSSKLFQETESKLIQSEAPYRILIHSYRCIVCAYNPHQDKPVNFKTRLFKLFGKYTRKELKRENSNS